jgi:hypothetical protein
MAAAIGRGSSAEEQHRGLSLLASVRPRRRNRNKPAPGTPGRAFLIVSSVGADPRLCQRLRVRRRRPGVRLGLKRTAAVRLPVVEATANVRSAVRPIDGYGPVASRAALHRHGVMSRSFVQTNGAPLALDLHFTGPRIRARHSTDLTCWSGRCQRTGVTPQRPPSDRAAGRAQ